jgi:hypothetical protein
MCRNETSMWYAFLNRTLKQRSHKSGTSLHICMYALSVLKGCGARNRYMPCSPLNDNGSMPSVHDTADAANAHASAVPLFHHCHMSARCKGPPSHLQHSQQVGAPILKDVRRQALQSIQPFQCCFWPPACNHSLAALPLLASGGVHVGWPESPTL